MKGTKRSRQGEVKIIQMCCVRAPTPHRTVFIMYSKHVLIKFLKLKVEDKIMFSVHSVWSYFRNYRNKKYYGSTQSFYVKLSISRKYWAFLFFHPSLSTIPTVTPGTLETMLSLQALTQLCPSGTLYLTLLAQFTRAQSEHQSRPTLVMFSPVTFLLSTYG